MVDKKCGRLMNQLLLHHMLENISTGGREKVLPTPSARVQLESQPTNHANHLTL